MKKSWLLGITSIMVLVALSFLWIMQPRSAAQENESVRQAIPESIKHLPLKEVKLQGNVATARLPFASQIDGFPCAAGWVHFTQSGRLRAFFLAEACMIQGNQIPKGTWVQLDDGLKLKYCFFPENTNIQEYFCNGGFAGAEGVSTAFYPSGRLKEFYPPKDIVIQGIPCKASVFSPIYLHESGSLKECTLFRDAAIGRQHVSEGNMVILNETGAVESINIPDHALLKRAQNWVMKLFDY